MNIHAGTGVPVREFRMSSGHGTADYLLFVDGKPVGALEAKPAGYAIYNVEIQIDKYANGLPAGLNPPVEPLPFLYISTGVETGFISLFDPDPKTRTISARWRTSSSSSRRFSAGRWTSPTPVASPAGFL